MTKQERAQVKAVTAALLPLEGHPKLVTVIELPSCRHIAYVSFVLPRITEDGGYRDATSFNAFFHSSRHPNRTKTRLFYVEDDEEVPGWKRNSIEKTGCTAVRDIWAFYKHIGYDYKRQKFL